MKDFCFLTYKPRWCWSLKGNKYYLSKSIGDQIWAHKDVPLRTSLVSLKAIIQYVINNPGNTKTERSTFFRFIVDTVPLKAYVGMDKWNGTIFVDLDLDKALKYAVMTKEDTEKFYKEIDEALKKICPNNYAYIEHSSSGIGIHCLFYFDCVNNESNYNKYAKYIYEVFRYKVDDYIEDFSYIFTNPSCLNDRNKSVVFDDIYKRPYQKCYITCKDCKVYDVSGYCDDIVVEEDEEQYEEEQITELGEINIKYSSDRKYELHYYDRLYVLTALKRFVKDKKKAYEMWYKFCHNLKLYKGYKLKSFINMFEQNWDKIDDMTGHLKILKMYGFNVDDTNISYYLNENQYLSDVAEDIVKNCSYGINIVVADTGTGKTNGWIILNDKYSKLPEMNNHRPILIIEPLNSIVESKYDEKKFRIVVGSKQIGNVDNYEMIITNYNHLVKYTSNGIEVKEDLDRLFSKFELVVIDESHIMMKDIFRADVLIPFMISLSNIKSTKIIIQTATPMFEHVVLPIKKTFYIHKKDTISKKIIFRKDIKFDIQNITCLVDYYVNNNKKVYVYWNNGSLQKMEQFKKCYHSPDKIVIYHKRNIDDDDMQYVTENHNIEDFNIIMSSVYFGVGNDLLDKLEDVAVIIIGNNPWQEDIQAIGRWRNVKSIECCIVVDDNDTKFLENTTESCSRYVDLYDRNKWINDCILKDFMNRDKSIVINRTAFQIKDQTYADILAKMKSSYDYCSQMYVKCKEFERRGYDVRTDIKPLEYNEDWLDEVRQYKKGLKEIRNKTIKSMLNGVFDYTNIDKDTKMSRCSKIIKAMKTRDLLQYCDMNNMIASKILRYNTFLNYYNRSHNKNNDYAELFSILWVKNHLDKKNKETKKFDDIELSHDQYVYLCGYLIWMSYRNKNDIKDLMTYTYISKFIQICDDMCNIEDSLIDRIFIEHYYDDRFNDFYKEFFNTDEELYSNIKDDITIENIDKQINKININDKVYNKTIKLIINYFKAKNDKKISGQIGGKIGGKTSSPKKKIKDLKTNKIYDSCNECAIDIGHHISYISKNKDRFVKIS